MDVIGPLVALAITILLLTLFWRRRGGSSTDGSTDVSKTNRLAHQLENALEDDHPETRTHLESPPTVRDLSVVGAGEEGEPVSVPTVRIDLGTIDAPKLNFVFEYVASVLETIHPILEDEEVRVRRYDVQFTFGPDGLLVSGECREVSVPPSMATRLLEEDGYRALELRRDVERGDDGTDRHGENDGSRPVLWGEC
ncbi:hypothetical protein [Halostagnicola sp. A-GB9-2]|uniref:hypothetical protein n=1 Tax=Halostagnicola sp. A-GB9-2 TaxID=3048066 RepID=UPI0024C04199|nr:hypothetical protein [Halostagnicola sp. A-GB9-2]MDJ1432420.1 hypothetical protein [Halostagnicola sp. A-GB9-2]